MNDASYTVNFMQNHFNAVKTCRVYLFIDSIRNYEGGCLSNSLFVNVSLGTHEISVFYQWTTESQDYVPNLHAPHFQLNISNTSSDSFWTLSSNAPRGKVGILTGTVHEFTSDPIWMDYYTFASESSYKSIVCEWKGVVCSLTDYVDSYRSLSVYSLYIRNKNTSYPRKLDLSLYQSFTNLNTFVLDAKLSSSGAFSQPVSHGSLKIVALNAWKNTNSTSLLLHRFPRIEEYILHNFTGLLISGPQTNFLRKLDVSYSKFKFDYYPNSFEFVPKLEELIIDYSNLRRFTVLAAFKLRYIKKISAKYCDLTDLLHNLYMDSPQNSSASLESIDLSYSDIPGFICMWPHLRSLNLLGNSFIMDPMYSLINCLSLEELYMENIDFLQYTSSISDYLKIPYFTSNKLKKLVMRNCKFEYFPTSSVSTISIQNQDPVVEFPTSLEYLDLYKMNLTITPELFKRLTNLKTINVSFSRWSANPRSQKIVTHSLEVLSDHVCYYSSSFVDFRV